MERWRISIRGIVQGVGFRPFVYRLAHELAIVGWVNNSPQGVTIEAQASLAVLNEFVRRLRTEAPPNARIQSLDREVLALGTESAFSIVHSQQGGERLTLVLPDLALCSECLAEMNDPHNRRYRYPFINCTHCGPRYSIIQGLPYDRPLTTMRHFPMCPECQAEYDDPLNRRFHAQPIACPVCGPQLAYWDAQGQVLAERESALQLALDALRAGKIIAVKGIGGFHLMCDARQAEAVRLLRQRKRRPSKPFALMFPDMEQVRAVCEVSLVEADLLSRQSAPIVLLRHRDASGLAPEIAPDGNPEWGVMLPYAPLHALLMQGFGAPVVATSANLTDEPICIDEQEALVRLQGIADAFLVHNRPIARPIDDSIARELLGMPQILRRARGFAPLPVESSLDLPSLVATGAHQKVNFALSKGQNVFISQHIGDLDNSLSLQAFEQVAQDFVQLYEQEAVAIVCDKHPDYRTSQWAQAQGKPVLRIQHHVAHAYACLGENQVSLPALALAWDGTGYGDDGTIWGGEFIRLNEDGSYRRVGSLRPFRLLGGEQAVREPRRVALALAYELWGDSIRDCHEDLHIYSPREYALFKQMLKRQLNSPVTTSMGRLFDGVASMLNLCHYASYEGEAAMRLEWACEKQNNDKGYHFDVIDVTRADGKSEFIVDYEPFVIRLLADQQRGVRVGVCASRFHEALAALSVQAAQRVGLRHVLLTGGVFQNRHLSERCVQLLNGAGFLAHMHHQVPPNDGGIAYGQLIGGRYVFSGTRKNH